MTCLLLGNEGKDIDKDWEGQRQEEKGHMEWEGLRNNGKHREGSEWLGPCKRSERVPMLCGDARGC